jgi:hypothetical protein
LTGIIELRKSQRTLAMESVMAEEYDKERAAALFKEARELTSHLKDEAEKIKAQMERVLEGGGGARPHRCAIAARSCRRSDRVANLVAPH